jgi:heme-degrading monooxygenase HmoA
MKSAILHGPKRLHLHGIFMEPRQSGMGGRGRLRSTPLGHWSGGTGGARHRCTPEQQLTEERMFIAIARFPEVPTVREAEFRAWFAWSNDQLRDVEGLQGRRLLRTDDGGYTALVEHDSAESFAAMHATDAASRVHAQLGELLLEGPAASTYEVVADLAKSGSCCGGIGGHGDARTHDLALASVGAEAQGTGGCCQRA